MGLVAWMLIVMMMGVGIGRNSVMEGMRVRRISHTLELRGARRISSTIEPLSECQLKELRLKEAWREKPSTYMYTFSYMGVCMLYLYRNLHRNGYHEEVFRSDSGQMGAIGANDVNGPEWAWAQMGPGTMGPSFNAQAIKKVQVVPKPPPEIMCDHERLKM